jgi:hypothetical protein
LRVVTPSCRLLAALRGVHGAVLLPSKGAAPPARVPGVRLVLRGKAGSDWFAHAVARAALCCVCPTRRIAGWLADMGRVVRAMHPLYGRGPFEKAMEVCLQNCHMTKKDNKKYCTIDEVCGTACAVFSCLLCSWLILVVVPCRSSSHCRDTQRRSSTRCTSG